MAKSKGKGLLRQKNARDKKVDAVVRIATSQADTHSGGAILVRRASLGGKQSVSPKAKPEPKPKKVVSRPPTAIALALTKAGIAPEANVSPLKGRGQSDKPVKPTVEPAEAAPKLPAARTDVCKPRQPKPQRKKAKVPKQAGKAKAAPAAIIIKRSKPERPGAFRTVSDDDARTERMQERRKEAARIISGIAQLPPEKLLGLWFYHLPSAENQNSAFQGLARNYVDAIEGEWRRRSILARLDPDHFDWPSTSASLGSGAFGSMEHAEGILGYLGYHVGKTGEPSAARRQMLLSRVFEGSLPPINGPDYMDEWSQPGTPARLRKMAESIASAVKSAKRRSNADYSVAIEHWEEDLRFLHDKYYVGQLGFGWPSPS